MTQAAANGEAAKGYPAVGECRLSLIGGIPGYLRVEVTGAERDSGLVPDPG